MDSSASVVGEHLELPFHRDHTKYEKGNSPGGTQGAFRRET